MEPNLNEFRRFAEELAREAAALVREYAGDFAVEIKDDGSPVTNVDTAVERMLRERIDSTYPTHGVTGEEYGARDLDAEFVWVVDPIDGTRQFSTGLANYGTLIALCRQAKPVVGIISQPVIGDIYAGVSGEGAWLNGRPITSRMTTLPGKAIACLADIDSFDERTRPGFEAVRLASDWNVYDGGCLGFAALAAGRIDICLYAANVECYDVCALVPVIEGAGGVITDWRGNPHDLHSTGETVASCSPQLHEKVLALLA